MSADINLKIKKLEKGPLQRFKNQNAALKKYGENGLKVYKAADGSKTIAEIAAETGVGEELASEIVDWLLQGGMVAIPGADEEKTVEQQARKKLREIVEAEEGTLTPVGEEDEIIPITAGGAKKGALKREAVKSEAKPPKPDIAPPLEENEEEEIITPVAEKDEIVPEIKEEIVPEAPPAKEEPKERKPQKAEKEKEEEIKPSAHTEEKEEPPEEEPEGDEEEENELTPVEKTINEKYGDVGLKVYALIDGQKTAEEIMSETGVSEAKLIEMLEYMEKQGIIKLEHPEAKAAEEAHEEKERFSPLADQSTAAQANEPNPIEVPSKVQIDLIKGFQVKTDIVLKFGEKGTKLLDAIDGKSNEVDLSAKLGIPIYEVRDILSYFSAKGITKSRQLTRNEVAKQYGDDSFAVYKKYGREGVLLYELIGKDMGIRQMAKMVTTQKDRFAEMFVFIHKVLGVDIPIDRDVIFAQLERKT